MQCYLSIAFIHRQRKQKMSSTLAHVLVTVIVILFHTQTSAQETSVFYVFSDNQQSSFNQCQMTKNCTLEVLLSSNILSDNVSNTVVILNPGVHTINSTINQVFSVNNATNFILTAANLSERIIVKCNGKAGFSFKFCNKLTIRGINFEGCTGHQVINIFNQNHNFITFRNFALHILDSTDVSISAIMVRNSGGIGLLVINVRGSFMLSDTVFTNNTCSNVWLFSNNSINIISSDTIIDVKNSRFEQITSCSYKNDGRYIHPIGVALTLIQIKFKVTALLSNVTLIQTSISINGSYKSQISLSNISAKNMLYRKNNPIVITNVSKSTMKDITIQYTKGSVIFRNCNNLRLQGQFIYQHNQGSLILLKTKVNVYNTTVIISNNKAIPYVPLLAYWSKINIHKSFIRVNNNTGQDSGGIFLAGTTINFRRDSKVMFLFNTGQWGGAMAFYQRSKLLFHNGKTNFTFVGNHAKIKGGAIYVQDTDYTRYSVFSTREEKQFYMNFFSIFKGGQPRFNFYNNTAGQAGSAVFGGNVSNSDIFYFDGVSVNDTSVVSSIPFRVCTCVYSKPNCSVAKLMTKVQPGQSYTLEIIAVGQRNGSSPSIIEANFIGSSQAQLKQTEYWQPISNSCTNLTYTVQFSSPKKELQLKTFYSTWRVKKPFRIIFYRRKCTIGFIFDSKTVRCICNRDITNHGMECDNHTLKINRLPSKWVNATYEHLDPTIRQHGVIVHDYCPFDYCKANSQQLDLHYPDQQCNLNRAGILCGACLSNFSHILGTSKCKQCNKPWIALIVPLTGKTRIKYGRNRTPSFFSERNIHGKRRTRKKTESANAPPTPCDRIARLTLTARWLNSAPYGLRLSRQHRTDYRLSDA